MNLWMRMYIRMYVCKILLVFSEDTGDAPFLI